MFGYRSRPKPFAPVSIGDYFTVHKFDDIYYIAILAVDARLNGDFPTLESAIAAAKEGDDICDWGSVLNAAKIGRFDERRAQYSPIWNEIAQRHGAVPTPHRQLTQQDVIRNLAANSAKEKL